MTSDSRSNHGSGHWASYAPPLRLPQSASATYSSSHEGSRATLQPREPLVATRQVVAKPTSIAFNLRGCGRGRSRRYATRSRDGIRCDPCRVARASWDRIGAERNRRREVCGLNVSLVDMNSGIAFCRFECVGLIHVKPKSVELPILVRRKGLERGARS
jgi:hypothetical protein